MYKGKFYFQYFFSNNRTPWNGRKKLSRQVIVTVNRGKANHCQLSACLAHVGIINNSKYRCNLENGILNHVLW